MRLASFLANAYGLAAFMCQELSDARIVGRMLRCGTHKMDALGITLTGIKAGSVGPSTAPSPSHRIFTLTMVATRLFTVILAIASVAAALPSLVARQTSDDICGDSSQVNLNTIEVWAGATNLGYLTPQVSGALGG